jgi:hypothetical protein
MHICYGPKSPASTVSHGDWRDRHQNLLEKDCVQGRQPLLLRVERQTAQVERNQGFACDVNVFTTGFLKKNNCVLFLFSPSLTFKVCCTKKSQLFSGHSDACAVTSMYVGPLTASLLFVLFFIQFNVY